MIAARVSDLERYKGLSVNLDKAIEWIATGAYKSLGVGKHPVDGDKVFATVQSNQTRPTEACRYEAHRAYIDIQMGLEGEEIIDVRPNEKLKVTTSYVPDIEYYADSGDSAQHSLLLTPGTALIFFPEDAHRPCMAVGGIPKPAMKLIVKVAV